MATFVEHPSSLIHGIAYPTSHRSGSRINSRVAAVPWEEKEQHPDSSTRHAGSEEGGLFQDSLIVSGLRPKSRNPWAAAGSLAFQLLLLAALIIIPLYHTETLPKREILTMLYAPPPAAASNATRFQAPTPTYTSTRISIPDPMHKTQEMPPPTPVGTTGGVFGGVPGGVPSGVLSEVLSSARSVPVPAKAAAPMPNNRIRVPAQVAEANLIHDVTPQYPPQAGRERIEGTVVLLAVIAKDGTVRDVRVESGLPILAQAAIDAVKQWRYKPYLFNGEPVEVDSQITINFTLSRS